MRVSPITMRATAPRRRASSASSKPRRGSTASCKRYAPSRRIRRACDCRMSSTSGASIRSTRRSRSAQEQTVDSAADVAQIRLVSLLELGDDASGIADVVERLAHSRPVHVAVAEVYPGIPVLCPLEIFEVDFDDAFAQRANPILGIPVEHDIADIKPGPDPGAVKLSDVLDHFERAEQEPVPHFFNGDDDLQLFRERNELANLRLRAGPGIAIRGLRIYDGRDQ